MARYIDAEKIDFSPLKNEFEKARAKVVIMGQPTAGVVEVVRCKDCVYWDGLGYSGRCEGYHNGLMRDYTNYDDYCSYGERQGNK